MAPVWFVVDGGELAFNTGKNTAKGRALARDPRVVMCVDDSRPPYSFVQVQGIASIGEDPQEVLDIATRTGGRYMGADRAEEYGRRNGVPGELVVRVKPTKSASSRSMWQSDCARGALDASTEAAAEPGQQR